MSKPVLLLSSAIFLGFACSYLISPAAVKASQEPAAAPAPNAAPNTTPNPVKATPESQAKAKKTYGFDCALCHGANGNGKTDLAKDMQLTLDDLSDPKTLSGKTDGDLFDIIRKGKDKMPPEDAARAKDDDVWNLVIYVRSLAKGGAVAAANQ
jgi:mono/diheme cytochrome c family protein